MPFCYLNGRILPAEKAKINLDDIGLLRGYGCFELVKFSNGRSFLLKEHLRRLRRSAGFLKIRMPLNYSRIEKIIRKLILKNRRKEGSLRLVLTGGRAAGLEFNPRRPTFFILVEKPRPLPARFFAKGIKLKPIDFKRQYPSAKHTDYIAAVRGHIGMKAPTAETLFSEDGYVYEGSTSNFFIFKGNRLVTPRDGILEGVTRNLVLKLAAGKFKTEERPLKFSELKSADEAFITSTTRGVLPVTRIGKIKIRNGRVGSRTKFLIEKLEKYVPPR